MLPALRVVAVLHALSMLLQPVLIGLFLSGQDAMIDMHLTNGSVVLTLCFVLTVLALVGWRRRLVSRLVFLVSAALFAVENVQMGVGYGHVLWLHVPMGVALFGGAAMLLPAIMRRRPLPVPVVIPVAAAAAVTGVAE